MVTKGNDVICDKRNFAKATVWAGQKNPMEDKTMHTFYPELFRTAMTLDVANFGKGFHRSAISEWFAFYSPDSNQWLRGTKKGDLVANK